MKGFKNIGVLFCIVLVLVLLAPSAMADVWNKKTIMTINQPLRIPGKVLPAGKYVFKLLDSSSNRHIVRILNEDETLTYATIFSIPNYRLKPAEKVEFGYWEMPKGSPVALRSWFYPGESYGHEFPYPKTAAREIATAMNQTVPSVPDALGATLSETPAPSTPASNELKTATVSEEKPKEEPATIASAAPVQSSSGANSTTSATSTEPPKQIAKALPKTASVWPLVGLAGLLSTGLALAVRSTRKRAS